MPGKAQPRAVRVAVWMVDVCIGALSRKPATGCGRLRAHGWHLGERMGTMFWIGISLAFVVLVVLLFQRHRSDRRGGDGGDGGGYSGSDRDGRDHDGGDGGGGDGGGD